MEKIDSVNRISRDTLEFYLSKYQELGYLCEITIRHEHVNMDKNYPYDLAVYKINDE
ncbi:hypothetical protein HCJ46_11720 [Listeria booriae]|uniref:hypothetical protein n=1 Tax=Listeria booriae TaxID=1552123 RepID=UPI001623E23D|nr:hypothetical protein [Listeria booriae]MBC1919410.1 hypothetical protein [Listeria booriae]MBC2067014.1 hypothetical protein [Listeria booriae]